MLIFVLHLVLPVMVLQVPLVRWKHTKGGALGKKMYFGGGGGGGRGILYYLGFLKKKIHLVFL
jgi:hypothetical protein